MNYLRKMFTLHTIERKKVIHLTAFEPEPAWKIQGVYIRLKELLEPLKCKIFILDNRCGMHGAARFIKNA